MQLAVSPDGKLLAATAELTDSLLIFDLSQPEAPRLLRGVAMPDGPFEPVFMSDGRTIFVTALNANRVAAVDTRDWTVAVLPENAGYGQPHGIALDRQGNVYITDYRDHRVRKVSSDGTITTFAGTGKAGFSGDGGPATAAQLYAPTGIAFDAKGNAYITDQFNERVRKVAPNGTITTFAGNGLNVKFKDGPATKAQLGNVFGVAVDKAGSVYIADSSPPRILKVSGGRLTRVAGRDPHGPSGGIGEGGPATAAQMAGPNGVAVDRKGNLYVVDTAYNTVRKVWNGRRAR